MTLDSTPLTLPALARLAAESADDVEVGIVTEAGVLDDREFCLALDETQLDPIHAVAVQRDGRIRLVRRTHRVRKGDAVVVHAAAGGVGLILAQWARHLGAQVIGVVGSDAKAAVALLHGCHHALVLGRDGLAARVREITGGLGAHVVYDSGARTRLLLRRPCCDGWRGATCISSSRTSTRPTSSRRRC